MTQVATTKREPGTAIVYLGFDLATHAGWGVLDAKGDRIASGVIDCHIRRDEGAGYRWVRFRCELAGVLDRFSTALVGYEKVERHLGTTSAHVYGELRGVLVGSLTERGREAYAPVTVSAVKRQATGKGNAPKDQVVKAAIARWGMGGDWTPANDDEADALWVAECLRLGITA